MVFYNTAVTSVLLQTVTSQLCYRLTIPRYVTVLFSGTVTSCYFPWLWMAVAFRFRGKALTSRLLDPNSTIWRYLTIPWHDFVTCCVTYFPDSATPKYWYFQCWYNKNCDTKLLAVNVLPRFEWKTEISQSARADETQHSCDSQFYPAVHYYFLSANFRSAKGLR